MKPETYRCLIPADSITTWPFIHIAALQQNELAGEKTFLCDREGCRVRRRPLWRAVLVDVTIVPQAAFCPTCWRQAFDPRS